MKTLKALGLFLLGSASTALLFSTRCVMNTEYPREGAVVYENDDIKVTRINAIPNDDMDLATIIHKKKD